MNKTDLIQMVAEKADLGKKDAEKALDAVIGTVTDTLAKGEKVSISASVHSR